MGPQQDRSASKALANGTAVAPEGKDGKVVHYKECQRNHAAGIGGYAVDGCREFMASAPAGAEALLCAACGCHRSFHKREVEAVDCDCSSDTSGR